MEKEGEKKDEQVRYGFVTNYEVDFGKVSQHLESQFCLLNAQAFHKFPNTTCVRRRKNALLRNTDWSRDSMGQSIDQRMSRSWVGIWHPPQIL